MALRGLIVLLAIVLALFVGFHYGSEFYPSLEAALHPVPAAPAPLEGKNSISNLTVRQTRPGVWTAEFDYFYTGEPAWAVLRIDLGEASGSRDSSTGSVFPEALQTYLARPQRGRHHASHAINYPHMQTETRLVTVKLVK